MKKRPNHAPVVLPPLPPPLAPKVSRSRVPLGLLCTDAGPVCRRMHLYATEMKRRNLLPVLCQLQQAMVDVRLEYMKQLRAPMRAMAGDLPGSEETDYWLEMVDQMLVTALFAAQEWIVTPVMRELALLRLEDGQSLLLEKEFIEAVTQYCPLSAHEISLPQPCYMAVLNEYRGHHRRGDEAPDRPFQTPHGGDRLTLRDVLLSSERSDGVSLTRLFSLGVSQGGDEDDSELAVEDDEWKPSTATSTPWLLLTSHQSLPRLDIACGKNVYDARVVEYLAWSACDRVPQLRQAYVYKATKECLQTPGRMEEFIHARRMELKDAEQSRQLMTMSGSLPCIGAM
jgi:hypothetical protein